MNPTHAWSDRHAWPRHTRHIADARDFVAERLERDGLHGVVTPVRLVASELVTNAVLHAATPFSVALSRSGGSLRLEVHDDAAHPLGAPARPAPTQPNGRGLGIVDRLSEQWGVDVASDGKTVWAVFVLPG